jgi:myo-inositol 2-dehydrogenase / D-chiro-inositol 1-dehydrogenase
VFVEKPMAARPRLVSRIALVGAGRMGRVHLRALQTSSELELAGVVEPFAANRRAVAAEGVAVYETVEQLLEADEPDGVLIAAPSDRHPELVSTFAAAEVAVLCEKPLGVRLADAVEATRAASDAGILLQVGYWRRFVPELGELRSRIEAGELGELNQLSCMQWDAEPPSEQFRAHSGGIAVDMGVHEFDQVRWLSGQEIGPLAAMHAGPASTEQASPADPDAATILAQLSRGAAATISLGRRFPHADSCWLEVWGTEGYERIPFMWDAAGEQVFLRAMVAQAESFARAIEGEPREGAGGDDAIAALAVAERVAAALSDAGPHDPSPPEAAS